MMHDMLHDTNFWVAISFLLFLFVAVRTGYGKVIGGLDNKIESIRKEIQEAEALRVEAQELLAQYRRKQKDALNEAESIINHARTHAESIIAQADEDLKLVMQRREAQLQDRLQRIEDAAVQDVKTYAASLAVDTARDLIYNRLDKKADASLIEKTGDNLKKLAG